MIDSIKGEVYVDNRGGIRFFRDFDMSSVKRFYLIVNTDTIGGWRAHRLERRCFFAVSRSFKLNVVKIDNWEAPSQGSEIRRFILGASDQKIIYAPEGCGIAFQALDEGAELLVFADYGIEHAKLDDYIYPLGYFVNRKELLYAIPFFAINY